VPKTASELFRSTHLSHSKLQTYVNCPRRFKLEYLDGCDSESSREIQLGSVVHALLADFLGQLQGKSQVVVPRLESLMPLLPGVCRTLRDEGELKESFSEREVSPLLIGFIKAMPRIDGRAIVHVEAKKRTRLGSLVLLSILDLVLRNERGEVHIIDFKTGNPKYVKEEQLQTYSLPILGSPQHDGSPVKLSYLFLRDGTVRSFQMQREECDAVVSRIMAIVRAIEADRKFEPKVNRLCDWCGVRRFCTAYRGK
jgi:putative RecB family exonuclease